jgi:orotidine-5'-phosphate decarboxylase
MINIHAQGGKLMMSKAVNVIRQHSSQKKIIAVTHLTSTSQEILERELLLSGDISDHCLNLAKLALDSGCDGVVASALDALKIKKNCGNNFKIISPGIRLPSDNINDQARVSTPQDAINQGADYLVIGRPITLSKDPKKTLQSIIGS